MNHGEIVSFLWGVADLIRDTFRRGKYQDVILPLTVLRRLDCVLAPTKDKVLKRQAELRGKCLSACNFDPPYCLICECYPESAVGADDPTSANRLSLSAIEARSTAGTVGGSGP